MSSQQTLPLNRESVTVAHNLIKSHIHLTPLLTCRTLDDLASTSQPPEALIGTPYEGQEPAKPKIRFYFKCENFQKVGAFKARGAFHAVGRLVKRWEEKGEGGEGVVTDSSGR